MMKFVVLLCLAASAFALPLNMTADSSDFKTMDPWNIIGGKVVSPAFKYPFLVALVQKGQTPLNGQFCGASLISANRVLTAAHCCDAVAADDIDVLIHWQDLSKTTQGERIAVSSMEMHPDYNSRTIDNDVCVLKLAQSTTQAPAKLDDGSHSAVGTSATVAGWGNTKTSGSSFPSQAMEVNVPIVSNEVCNSKESYGGEITKGMMCAGFGQGGKDACQGDSGGPLFVDGVQIGVVSWGYGCAQPDMYGVYARVSVFKAWIENQME